MNTPIGQQKNFVFIICPYLISKTAVKQMKLARIYLIREINCDSVSKMKNQYKQLKSMSRSCTSRRIFDLEYRMLYQISNNLFIIIVISIDLLTIHILNEYIFQKCKFSDCLKICFACSCWNPTYIKMSFHVTEKFME